MRLSYVAVFFVLVLTTGCSESARESVPLVGGVLVDQEAIARRGRLPQDLRDLGDLCVNQFSLACDVARLDAPPSLRLDLELAQVRHAEMIWGFVWEPNANIGLMKLYAFNAIAYRTLTEKVVPLPTEQSALIETRKQLVEAARQVCVRHFDEELLATLDSVVAEWAVNDPNNNEQNLRLSNLGDKISARTRDKSKGGSSSLLSVVALDPFAGLDPTARALVDLRRTADRALYLSERLPMLMRWQTNILVSQQALSPTGNQLLLDMHALAGLPAQITAERKAITDDLVQHEARLTALAESIRGALDSGRMTAEALTGTIAAFDRLAARFDKPDKPVSTATPPSRPFDITEYERTATAIAKAAGQLDGALGTAGTVAGSEALTERINQLEATGNRLLLRLAVLGAGLMLLAAGAGCAVLRWGRRR